MGALEQFLHAKDDGLPTLVRAGLAHVQFETIHPFLDGNGRTGRLLITFLLCHVGVLSEPLLYLSLYFKQYRSDYYELLNLVRRTGDWEAWLEFFLQGVQETAEGAFATSQRLSDLFGTDQARIRQTGRRSGSVLRTLQAFMSHPILYISGIRERTGLSISAATAAVTLLEELGIVREITGQRRNRLFTYDAYLSILSEGTEPL